MIGLDTNVFLRLFVEDDAEQTRRAREYVERVTVTDVCFVNAVVLAEFVWTLGKRMKRTKAELARIVEEVLTAKDLIVAHSDCAERALAAFKNGKAEFADYFLAEINPVNGCATTVTFDADALEFDAFSSVR